LAAGLPVVTTPLLDLAESPPDLVYAGTHAEWERALERVFDAPADPARRRALARGHDWDAIAARMVAEIEKRAAAAGRPPPPPPTRAARPSRRSMPAGSR